MSGLEASLVLIGVTLGLLIVAGALTGFAIFSLYRLRFGRRGVSRLHPDESGRTS